MKQVVAALVGLVALGADLCSQASSAASTQPSLTLRSQPVSQPVSQQAVQAVQAFKLTADGTLVPVDGTPAVAAAADGAGASASEAAPSPRRQGLAKLAFDRRPSAILKAWSEPEPEPVAYPDPLPEADAVAAGAGAAAPTESTEPAETAETSAAPAEPSPEDAERARLAAEHAEAEAQALAAELALFQRRVTLGRWDAVRAYLAELPEAEAQAAYAQLAKNLAQGPPKQGGQYANYEEANYFEPSDVVGLFAAAHGEVDTALVVELGKILKRCVDAGNLIERCIAELEAGLAEDGFPLSRAQLARAVVESGNAVESGAFLPTPAEAIAAGDREVMNLVARHYMGLFDREDKVEHLEHAWEVTQAALADGDVSDEVKDEALARATLIAPRLREELGQAWLDESFTARPERGMEVLSVIGSDAAAGMVERARDQDQRFESLQLQTTAAEALLAAAPERATEWGATLSLLAANWLREADYARVWDTSTQKGPAMQRDPFGNIFYYNYGSMNRIPGNQPQPIGTADVLKIRPSDAWLAHVSAGLAPRIDMVTAQLLLKVGEEEDAFPFIERLAPALPDRAEELVEEFLRIWAENNNPNGESQRTNAYMFMYGFETRANAIPLTRSKQERNLANLAGWIERIRALPIDGVDEELLAKAFTAAHSTAEVYQLDTIERVFGALGDLKPRTLAELVQTMRGNLVGIWRRPDVQKDKGTRRREKDIQAEVLRGYAVADGVIAQALKDHPDEWSLVLARAAVAHDLNDYKREIEKDSGFAERRAAAMDDFQLSADLYRAAAPELAEDERTTKVYETWFYAALGASDLNQIDHERTPLQAEFPRIRAALLALPGELAQTHLDMFANTLFTRMSSVNPVAKFRYVRAGLEIVGDNERAAEAREVNDYYADLVSEIRLETRIDGGTSVGTAPFGLFVNLKHTREIEREAGGFGKYLVNQNNQAFAYNYGRPTEDYRDKFEQAAREALGEQFEVLSVTFNHPDATSRALPEYGWRETPYAYLLLKARGPETDRVPSLRLDLDFVDTSGYAILPIESPDLPIDAAGDAAPYGFDELHLVQTLDERRASEGRLILEVKATARGLVPALDELLAIDSPGFEVAEIEDQGLSVSEFDREADDVTVLSDRTWLVSLTAREGLAELPAEFRFATLRADAAESLHQRYVDEDLASVGDVVALEHRYGEAARAPIWPWALGILAVLGAGAFAFVRLRSAEPAASADGPYRVPERVTPFTVLGLLEGIQAGARLGERDSAELAGRIADLERTYFRNGRPEEHGEPDDGVDLHGLARDWVRRAR